MPRRHYERTSRWHLLTRNNRYQYTFFGTILATGVSCYQCCRLTTLAGMGERRLLTIPQAAREIGMSRVVLWRHVRKGNIPSEQAGPYVLIDADDLAAFKAQERRPGWKPGRPRRPRPAE